MKSGNGSHELTRLMTAYLTSLAFGITFLIASLVGVDGTTALWRSVTCGALAMLAGRLLAPPVVDAVLTALSRDELARQQRRPGEDEA